MFKFLSSKNSCEGIEFSSDKWQIAIFFADRPKPLREKPELKKTNYWPSQKHLFCAKGSSGHLSMQFRQTCPKFLAGICKKKSIQAPKKTKTCQLLSSKCSCREVECSFDKPADWFFDKIPKFSAHHPKRKKNSQNLYSQMIPLDTYKAVMTELPPRN